MASFKKWRREMIMKLAPNTGLIFKYLHYNKNSLRFQPVESKYY